MLALQTNQALAGVSGKPRLLQVSLAAPDTGLTTQANTTISGELMAKSGSANIFLCVGGVTASPFINATLYNSLLNTTTNLTISGALAETLSNAAQTVTDGCYLVWSTEQSKWYLKTANTTVHKVYPLTLSGTTLTIGAAIDISATYAAAKADEVAMCGDDTDLWFIDLSGANGPRKYDLSASSMGSAGAAPTNTNYLQATSGFLANHKWIGSNTKLWLVSASTASKNFKVFQEYSIAGDSWTDKGVPAELKNAIASMTWAGCDPLSPTYLYFVTMLSANATIGDAPQQEPQVIRWKISTNVAETYCMLETGQTGFRGVVNAAMQSDPALAQSSAAINTASLAIAIDEEDDIVFGYGVGTGAHNIYNVGKKHGRKTILDYTGSGFFHGLSAPRIWNQVSASAVPLPVSPNLTVILTVDGTEYNPMLVGNLPFVDALSYFNVPFATSLKVEVVGAWHDDITSNLRIRPMVTLKATITG